MIVSFLVILALGAWIYFQMQAIGAKRASQHQYTFTEYVQNHHLGTLLTIDDGTGLDPISYVLNLNQPVADSAREALIVQLMKVYATRDHGVLLTLDYVDPTTKQSHAIAEANLNDDTNTLILTVHYTDGTEKVTTEHVKW